MALPKEAIDISAVNALIDSGDISLAEHRQLFRKYNNQACTLSDDMIKLYIASEEDDMDPEDRAEAMLQFQLNPTEFLGFDPAEVLTA